MTELQDFKQKFEMAIRKYRGRVYWTKERLRLLVDFKDSLGNSDIGVHLIQYENDKK